MWGGGISESVYARGSPRGCLSSPPSLCLAKFVLVVNERAKCDSVTQSLIISSTAKQNTRWDDQGARR